MTKFNPKNKEILTNSDTMDPAMRITEQEDADQYFKEYVDYLEKRLEIDKNNPIQAPDMDLHSYAEKVARENLGYWAGYYDNDTRVRVEELFNCAHPVFGKIAERGAPTSAEAFTLGLERGSGITWTANEHEDDFTAVAGEYTLRVEQLDKRKWWWSVSHKLDLIADSSLHEGGYPSSMLRAKQLAIQVYSDHKRK